MNDFQDYIRTNGHTDKVNPDIVKSLIDKYPWFTVAHIVKEVVDGEHDGIVDIIASRRCISSLRLKRIDYKRLAEVTEGEIIDKFLQLKDYRIVVDDVAESDNVCTEANLDEEDDIVSEELAEVYARQGLKKEAIAIYHKLSLLNTEKSVYFVEKIKNLTKE